VDSLSNPRLGLPSVPRSALPSLLPSLLPPPCLG
jgi:hypothetical protein